MSLTTTATNHHQINLIWEVTQATIAIIVTTAALYASLNGKEGVALTNAFFLVIGFYFGRTNHARLGSGRGEPTKGTE